MANIKISELNKKESPSTSATLVGVDNGETVQIPASVFQNQIDYINMVIREDLIEYDDAVINGGQTDPVNISSPQAVSIRNNGEVYDPNAIIMNPNTGISLRSSEGVNINSNSISITNNADQETGLVIEGRSTDLHSVRKLYAKDDDEGLDTMPAGCVLTSGDGSKIRWSNDYVHSDTLDDKLLNKVDKVSGKGLSTNDYTTAEKNKLAGLAAVATSGSYNDLTDKPTIPSGGGSGGGIIDVTELPTENINEDAFYRLLTGTFVYNQFSQNSFTCYCVETLPEVGEPATTDMTTITAYYNVEDGICYGYVDSALSSAMSVPAGWYDASVLLPAAGYAYGGVVTSLDEATLEETFYLMLQYVIYSYKDGWTVFKSIGKSGTGVSAEVFNHPSNIASGDCSHAEGYNTMASGNYSHSEGAGTTASNTYSHAEGVRTEASGHTSHAEGYYTIASGDCSHVQGKYNVEDTTNTYAHIVGNGEGSSSRSNAHTLDWSGNAWFQGNIYVGGTGQDDTNAKKMATEEYVDEKVSNMSGGGSGGGGGIITVESLPTENIDASAIYKVTENDVKVGIYECKESSGEIKLKDDICEIVDVLPETGTPCLDFTIVRPYHWYYQKSDGALYGYADEVVASEGGVDVGWYPIEFVYGFMADYKGMVYSTLEIMEVGEAGFYAVVTGAPKTNLYHYKNGAFAKIASFPTTNDIVATPNPCIYKVYEIDEFHIIGVVTDENGVVTNTYIDDMEGMNVYTEVVNELPEIGEGFIKDDGTAYLYYTRIEGSICAYLTEEIASAFEMPVGWLPFMSSGEFPIIESLEDVDGEYDTYGLVAKKPHLYFYDGDDWLEISTGFRIVHNPKLETITFIES